MKKKIVPYVGLRWKIYSVWEVKKIEGDNVYVGKPDEDRIYEYYSFKEFADLIREDELIDYKEPEDMKQNIVGYKLFGVQKTREEWQLLFPKTDIEAAPEFEVVYEEVFPVGSWVFVETLDNGCQGLGKLNAIYKITDQESGNGLLKNQRHIKVLGKSGTVWKIWGKFRRATPQEIEQENSLEVAGYKMSVNGDTFFFGCQKNYNLAHIEAYEKLLEAPGASIKIGTTNINKELLTKIKAKLNSK